MRLLATVLFVAARLAAMAYHQVDFTSSPANAKVFIDGELKGMTPLALRPADISAGAPHRLRIVLDGYDPYDAYFSVEEGDRIVRHAELVPVKGLLLVTTQPEGAEISKNGYSLGVTPRLVTTLDAKDVHQLVLRKPGYQDRRLEVVFNGRDPLVHNVDLVLDSGMLDVKTLPSGASVEVNGVPRGETPLAVSGIPKGRATVRISKHGFVPVVREIAVAPGDRQEIYLPLEPKPGAIKLASVPEGARFYVNGESHGKGNVTVDPVKPGSYVVRAELEGYAPQEHTVKVGLGETVSEEFRLASILGRLEIRTIPVGARIYVDGKMRGVTSSDNATAEASDVLVVDGLEAGKDHTVIIKCPGYAEAVRHPEIEVSKATQLDVRMKRVFKPNVRIVTPTGTVEGVLVKHEPAFYLVEVSLGVTRAISAENVVRCEPILEE